GRHAVSRRNRRHADGGADPSVTGAATGRIHDRGRPYADQDRCAHRRGEQHGSAYPDSAGPVSRGLVFPLERRAAASASVTRADRGSVRFDPAFFCAGRERRIAAQEARYAGAGAPEAASLANWRLPPSPRAAAFTTASTISAALLKPICLRIFPVSPTACRRPACIT